VWGSGCKLSVSWDKYPSSSWMVAYTFIFSLQISHQTFSLGYACGSLRLQLDLPV
jgi:hypothetical protein